MNSFYKKKKKLKKVENISKNHNNFNGMCITKTTDACELFYS